MAPNQADRDSIRSLLAMVRGVESVRVTGSNGTLERIEVLLDPGESEGRVVRDIESALASGLDFDVDHQKIRVVPGGESRATLESYEGDSLGALGLEHPDLNGPREAPARPSRLRLVDVCVEENDESPHAVVEVTVALDHERLTGRVRDADTPRGRMISAARAALRAVEKTMDGSTALLMEGIEELTVSEQPGLIALVRSRQGRESRTMYGCALVDTHPAEAAARAALDAVNRFWDAERRVPASHTTNTGKETG